MVRFRPLLAALLGVHSSAPATSRRRSSTRLTPRYEATRSRDLKRCQAQFQAGKVGAHFEPIVPEISGETHV